MWWLALTAAVAGYGDPNDGYPSHAERELHVWTNAVRVEPTAFEDDYRDGGCSLEDFTRTEREPQRPLAWSSALNAAARGHTEDMRDNNFLSHSSSDGTSMGVRVSRFYGDYAIGENVAMGDYPSMFEVVGSGWMCSSGHRANIMASDWEEFGGGALGGYFTQNFGARGAPTHVMNMGVHLPEEPVAGDVTFLVDVTADTKVEQAFVVVNGASHPMDVIFGSKRSGLRVARVPFEEGCAVYWFETEVEGEAHRFPEDGAYAYGDCTFDDKKAGWLSAASLRKPGSPVAGSDVLDDEARGCQQSPGSAWWASWLLLLAVRRRR